MLMWDRWYFQGPHEVIYIKSMDEEVMPHADILNKISVKLKAWMDKETSGLSNVQHLCVRLSAIRYLSVLF